MSRWTRARHVASDGSHWHVLRNPKPIPTEAFDWDWSHADYDGAPDAHDHRCGHAASREEAEEAIEEWIREDAHARGCSE